MSRAILWFRMDQRLSDNAALTAACAVHEEVLPVLVIDPQQTGAGPFGFARLGAFRAQFWREGIADLDAQLRAKGNALVVRNGDPVEMLHQIASVWNAEAVYAHRSCTWEEQKQEARVAQRLQLHLFAPDDLLHEDDLPFTIDLLPHVFTAFRNKVEKTVDVRTPLVEPAHITPPVGWLEQATLDHGIDHAPPAHDPREALHFVGGRSAASARIAHYFGTQRHLSCYKQTRNGLLGADYSSKLSPWLATGAISAREVYANVKRYEGTYGANESTYWLIFELLWRDFFRLTAAKHGRKLFLRKGIAGRPFNGTTDVDRFGAWCLGRTGQPFIDANMRELAATGWMSNRGRQNVASYLVHDLGLDWRMGASWFERLLLDYDPHSNWGNWQYVAGVGNDPREGRRFDPVRQAGMYDADGAFVRLWS